jgi:thiosulfate reductase cytochrome b subunit
MRPWMLFAFPALIAVPVVLAIWLVGPVGGFVIAAIAALALIWFAIRPEDIADAPADHTWRATALRRFLIPVAIAIPGIVLVATTDDVAFAIGWGLIGVGLVVAISLAFLEVGLSEERAREAEERTRGTPPA